MKEIKNKFIQHLLDFGEAVIANGDVIEESDFQKAYIYRTKEYDYCFKTMNLNDTEIHTILVIKNFGTVNGKEIFSPLYALNFIEDGSINIQKSDELAKNTPPDIENTNERYYGKW